MKRPFLVVYDYGQGGVWAILFAQSATQIEKKFPELQIVARRPKWMSESRMAELERTMRFDIDNPRGFLERLLAKRTDGGEGRAATRA